MYAQSFLEDLDTDDDLLAVLHHQLVVTGQIRFALYAVDDEHFGFLARRRQQFDVCREASATETYYTCGCDLVDDLFRLQGTLVYEVRFAINLRQPLVTLYVDVDSLSGSTPCVGPVTDLGDRTAYRRADVCTHESAGFSQQFAHFHFLTNLYHGLSRSTDVLHQRNDGLLRQRALFNRLVCRVLLVVLRMNSAYFKCSHKSFSFQNSVISIQLF